MPVKKLFTEKYVLYPWEAFGCLTKQTFLPDIYCFINGQKEKHCKVIKPYFQEYNSFICISNIHHPVLTTTIFTGSEFTEDVISSH